MHRLMLQRAVQGDDIAAQDRQAPPGQGMEMPGQQAIGHIGGNPHMHRRPIDGRPAKRGGRIAFGQRRGEMGVLAHIPIIAGFAPAAYEGMRINRNELSSFTTIVDNSLSLGYLCYYSLWGSWGRKAMKRQDTVQAFRKRLDDVIERSGLSRAAFAK